MILRSSVLEASNCLKSSYLARNIDAISSREGPTLRERHFLKDSISAVMLQITFAVDRNKYHRQLWLPWRSACHCFPSLEQRVGVAERRCYSELLIPSLSLQSGERQGKIFTGISSKMATRSHGGRKRNDVQGENAPRSQKSVAHESLAPLLPDSCQIKRHRMKHPISQVVIPASFQRESIKKPGFRFSRA